MHVSEIQHVSIARGSAVSASDTYPPIGHGIWVLKSLACSLKRSFRRKDRIYLAPIVNTSCSL